MKTLTLLGEHLMEKSNCKSQELESKGWKEWLMTLFPFWFGEAFSDDHIKYWSLHWSVIQRIKKGEIIPNAELVRLLILGRGLGKSATLEAGRIMRGAILSGGYSLMISETDDQAQEHLGNARILIEHPDSKLLEYYPEMAIADQSDALKGLPTSDRKEMFICKNGYILRAKGLTAKMRGLRVCIYRPNDITLDEIDDVNDSLVVSANKLRLITSSILPVQARENVTIDVGQNLITEHSIVNQIYQGKTDALSERTVIGVSNAFSRLDIDTYFDNDNRIRHRILPTSIASWEGLNIHRAQKFLDDSGKETFLAEYQNEFNQFKSGRVVPEYNEASQVITWSEFANVFGQRSIPRHWKAKAGLDVGYSDGQYPHYSAWVFVATAAMNSAFPNSVFVYRGRSFVATSIDDQANTIKQEIGQEFSQVTDWQMSHERTGEMMTLNQKYQIPFRKFQHYKAEDGVAQWRHLSKADTSKPNPFKEDEQLADGTWLLGQPNLYYVVDDAQLARPMDDRGLRLLREQVSTWEYVPVKLTETGQTAQKPSKINDDFCDSLKSILAMWGAIATPLTLEERIVQSMPEAVRPETIAKIENPEQRVQAINASRIVREQVTNKLNKPQVRNPLQRLRYELSKGNR